MTTLWCVLTDLLTLRVHVCSPDTRCPTQSVWPHSHHSRLYWYMVFLHTQLNHMSYQTYHCGEPFHNRKCHSTLCTISWVMSESDLHKLLGQNPYILTLHVQRTLLVSDSLGVKCILCASLWPRWVKGLELLA